MKPKVAVLGAGAMGSLFGSQLAEGGLDVTLIDVWRDHVDAINDGGLRCSPGSPTCSSATAHQGRCWRSR